MQRIWKKKVGLVFYSFSIELECINWALQKDMLMLREVTSEVPKYKEKISSLQEEYSSTVHKLKEDHKQICKTKKQKYIEKMKTLESKFTKMWEEKMQAIKGKTII